MGAVRKLSKPVSEILRKAMTSRTLPTAETAASKRARDADRLVRLAREGDPQAFDALVRRFRPRIYALALHLSGSASDADDIAQEAFEKAYLNLDRFEGRSPFFTWLYRVTINRALNTRRDRERRGSVPLDDVRVATALRVDAQGDPRRALELRETYVTLVEALDRLSPALRSAVVLTTLSGLSYQEAAVVLRTSDNAIGARLHEARRRLRSALEHASRGAICTKQQPACERQAEHNTLSLDLMLAIARAL